MGQFPNPETQFQAGESGNPGGRPKGASKTAAMRRLVLLPYEEIVRVRDDATQPMVERIAAKDVLDAWDTESERVSVDGEGNESRGGLGARAKYTEFLHDRLDGKAPSHISSDVHVTGGTILEDRRTRKPEETTDGAE